MDISFCRSLFIKRLSAYPEGTIPISGYASVFGVRDSTGEITNAETFIGAVAEFNAPKIYNPAEGIYPYEMQMWFHHNPRTYLGEWTHMEIDSYGLYVEGYLDPDSPDTQKLLAKWRISPFNGLSTLTGGNVELKGYEKYDRLWEVSLVTQGANPEAYFDMPAGDYTERTPLDLFLNKLYSFLSSTGHK